ncbi:uncharacterized protein SPPG_06170 [Spizellomyces punctatus DAOM BR117]|uniref:Uncharacterized protein n=1 Tax=Spizellomyces punctatus (strain DAOM BR117) TaxID=645134 RepID=A0A0L0HC57_SPIPD|nr:uncharacterized protein SPPG_06170 [Spizellomyces punctatus DAOM BR117]KNC98469.1 hypothetical protein SPPG_06170 [Spizellomyces punctatus DAOM BR117]|eukprot:XP_016606509.1 hypothetical protein SPPG_06170 [Spizellomyces punctatus DAOM BR117]
MRLSASLIPLAMLVVSGLPSVVGDVWLTFSHYTQSDCSGSPVGFFYADWTQYAQLMAGLNSTWSSSAAAVANVQTCQQLIAAQKEFPSSFYGQLNSRTSISLTAGDILALNLAIKIFADVSVDLIHVQDKLDAIQAGTCYPNLQTRWGNNTYGYLKPGCVVSTTAPALPGTSSQTYSIRASTYTPVDQNSTCGYKRALGIMGVLADDICRTETGIIYQVGQSNVGRACVRATCSGDFPKLYANASALTWSQGGFGGIQHGSANISLNVDAYANACELSGTPYSHFTTCKVGGYTASSESTTDTKKPGNGKSFVDNITYQTHGFTSANQGTRVTIPGNAGIKLRPSGTGNASVTVNVTSSPDPITALTIPPTGINTYWRFEATANATFSADLSWTYTDADLALFNYTATSLKWAFYNQVTGTWDTQSGTTVDTSAKTVGYTTTHFSEWTIVASATSGALSSAPSLVMVLVAVLVGVLSV